MKYEYGSSVEDAVESSYVRPLLYQDLSLFLDLLIVLNTLPSSSSLEEVKTTCCTRNRAKETRPDGH